MTMSCVWKGNWWGRHVLLIHFRPLLLSQQHLSLVFPLRLFCAIRISSPIIVILKRKLDCIELSLMNGHYIIYLLMRDSEIRDSKIVGGWRVSRGAHDCSVGTLAESASAGSECLRQRQLCNRKAGGARWPPLPGHTPVGGGHRLQAAVFLHCDHQFAFLRLCDFRQVT